MSLRKLLVMTLCCVAVVAFAVPATAQDLMITMYMDGTLGVDGGGSPKTVELYAINAIPDLSEYALSRAGNGSPTFDAFTVDHVLPAVALAAGDYYYGVGNSFNDMTNGFDMVWPAKSGIRARNFGVNSNGDDVTGLFHNPTGDFVGAGAPSTVWIDAFGDLGVDGTGTPWQHNDSYARATHGRTPGTTFVLSEWIIAAPDTLDGLAAQGIDDRVPDMRFNPVVPEPAGVTLVIAGLLGMAGMRRRWG